MNIKHIFKKRIVKILLVVAILFTIALLLNAFIPVKNMSKDDISINLSTAKPTGSNIDITISTKTKYNIFYFIDYDQDEEYYEESFAKDFSEVNFENESEEITEDAVESDDVVDKGIKDEGLNIKNISDKEYQKKQVFLLR